MERDICINIDYIRRLRRQHKLKLDEVATIVGCNRTSVWRWEAGKVNMPVAAVIALADLYNVSIDDLRWRDPADRQGR